MRTDGVGLLTSLGHYHHRLELERLDHPTPKSEIGVIASSLHVVRWGRKVGSPKNWEVPQNHDFEVIEPVNLGQLLILKCPRFLEMGIPKWLTRQICRLTRKFHYAYRFVDKNRTNTRFASVRASARSTRRAEANRVFVLDLTTKRYVCKRLASLHKFLVKREICVVKREICVVRYHDFGTR